MDYVLYRTLHAIFFQISPHTQGKTSQVFRGMPLNSPMGISRWATGKSRPGVLSRPRLGHLWLSCDSRRTRCSLIVAGQPQSPTVRVIFQGMRLAPELLIPWSMSPSCCRIVERMLPVAGLLAVTSVLSGCFAPEPVIRMTPLSGNSFWVKGTQVSAVQGKSARAAVAFLRDYDSQVSFRVEVENDSPEPVVVDPANFYYTRCVSPEAPNPSNCGTSHWVVNPEQVLLDLDAKRSRESANNNNETLFFMPFVLLDTVAAVGGAATGNHRLASHALADAGNTAAIMDGIDAKDRNQADTYESKRSMWETGAFRKTTIFPGQRAAGMVFIPHDLSSNSVKLQVRVGKEVLAFSFRQTVYQLGRR